MASPKGAPVVETPNDPAPQTSPDRELIQGTWEIVSCEYGGEPVAKNLGKRDAFKGNRCIPFKEGWEGTFKLDPTKTPKQMDVISNHDGIVRTFQYIYHLDEDTLITCGGTTRPTEFATNKGDAYILVEYRRISESEE